MSNSLQDIHQNALLFWVRVVLACESVTAHYFNTNNNNNGDPNFPSRLGAASMRAEPDPKG